MPDAALPAYFPPVPYEDLEVHGDAERTWSRLLADIAGAREEVSIENYILVDGEAAYALLAALRQAQEQGARVRVHVDGAGSYQLTGRLKSLFGEVGELRIHNPLRVRNWVRDVRGRLLRRTHRRLVVVDHDVAWTGGVAFEDPWYPVGDRIPVRDMMVRVSGPVVDHFRESFERLWDPVGTGKALPRRQAAIEARQVQCAPHYPGRNRRAGMRLERGIERAQKRVWLGTAYFVPPRRLRAALYHAAGRGLDVRLLVPGPAGHDHPIVRTAGRRYYGRMLGHGVRVFEYQPSFYHAKCFVADDELYAIGTLNLDRWSFFLNHEIGLLVRDAGTAAQVRELMEADFADSEEIDPEAWRARPLRERIAERFTGLFDRMM